ncbi:hypothetical protein PTNB73_04769 [Pyrenophora teres f. teres]|uniref:RRM domain-containing protein n=2 Tax=Pyrenophora teres f. teres TaxID=97479 RepID=E3RNQ7_PYRTT|nr:hypothetical protein PTT_10215 [Pyrenophora teres f. teres 0-1]KAE8833851.1 hypothetical protein HRS9139_05670 [Pyrenophora teres f. teres]KAE8840377.1 hypothetical protein PTNB85_03776 [Pyrenophora teres f. teres]KAE8849482.1 hypothetical protein HRS9122_03498 [Pyrenophora teres f. teres]KAE8863876.1 hypothetical protein PTNB29_03840 [Pyrenophora teres f. teres]
MTNSSSEAKTASPSNRAHQLFTKAIHSLHLRRAAPPQTPIPINPHSVSFAPTPTPPPPPLPVQQAMQWVTIELSGYPPQFTHQDVRNLFQGFTISPDFTLPNAVNLAYPLRTFINIAGQQEAERAVQELCSSIVGGRAISVKMVEKTGHEEGEQTAEDMANEKKTEIIRIARVSYPHLASKFLEVREHFHGIDSFAFLQARDITPLHSEPEAHMQPGEKMVKWELVASGRSGVWSWKMKDGSGRLAALKCLRDVLEMQGNMRRVWRQWEGSVRLDM